MSITISLKLLATYRYKLPPEASGNTCQIEVPEGSCAEDVLATFDIPTDKSSVILVNGHTPEEKQLLQEGDILCAFSAVAGG